MNEPLRLSPEQLLSQTAWLRRLARRLVRDADLAEDVVQDTLVAALEHGPPSQPDAGLRAWLATVARNFARRRQRGSIVRAHHEGQAAARRGGAGGDASDEIDRLRTQQMLTAAVLRVREPYRSSVVLRYQQGLSFRALAKRFGITQEAARKRVSRGLALLRKDLDGLDDANRRTWCLALTALVRRPRATTASAVSLGGITMGTKSVVLTAAAAVVVAGLWVAIQSGAPASPQGVERVAHVPNDTEALPTPRSAHARVVQAPSPHLGESTESPSAEPSEDRLLRGRVVDPAGEPVAGATVDVLRDDLRGLSTTDLQHDHRGEPLATRTTDAAGSFAFEVTPGRPYDLRAAYADMGRGLRTSVLAGRHVEIVLNPAARLVGRVLRADGSPVAGARIQGSRADSSSIAVLAGSSDERGEFAFDDLLEGAIRLRVIPLVEAPRTNVAVTLTAGETSEVELEVRPGYTVRGRVVDARTLQPIEGAEVGQGWTFTKSVRTDRNGEYVLPGFVTRGVYEVAARAPGYARVQMPLPDRVEGERNVHFALPAGVGATGRLLTPDGAPIANAYVGSVSTSGDWRATRTQNEGHFALEDLEPDVPHCLFVVADGFGTAAFEFPRPLRFTGVYEFGDVALSPAALLRGRLVDPAGEPIAGETIQLTAEYDHRLAYSGFQEELVGEWYVAERSIQTDGLGRFCFGALAPGNYTIGTGPSGKTDVRSIRVRAGDQVEDIELVLDAPWAFSGLVVDDAGAPVASIGVAITPEPPTDGRIANVITGADGRFRADGFALGTYRIEAFPISLDDGVPPPDVGSVTLEGVEPTSGELRIALPSR